MGYNKFCECVICVVEILKRLNRIHRESFEKISKAKFWREEMKQEIQHNNQIDVVFALWSKAYI